MHSVASDGFLVSCGFLGIPEKRNQYKPRWRWLSAIWFLSFSSFFLSKEKEEERDRGEREREEKAAILGNPETSAALSHALHSFQWFLFSETVRNQKKPTGKPECHPHARPGLHWFPTKRNSATLFTQFSTPTPWRLAQKDSKSFADPG